MKLPSKPMSSPGRVDKYPPPLMRFLRTNADSRSRGRSRSSPMFLRKKPTTAGGGATQEPTSPKVTCIGQVRIRHSNPTRKPTTHRRCSCLRTSLLSRLFNPRPKPRPFWPKWVIFFRRKPEIITAQNHEKSPSSPSESTVLVSSSIPPTNALILTRCRSAPYRSSSLANQFWGSETEQKKNREQLQIEPEIDIPTSKIDTNCTESDSESLTNEETEKKLVFSVANETSKTEDLGSVRPLILTRCKSEPARVSDTFEPDIHSEKNEGLDCKSQICD